MAYRRKLYLDIGAALLCRNVGWVLSDIRRAPERLSFAAPELVRGGLVELEILARVTRRLDLAPDAIMASNWVDNGSGWLAIMLLSREDVLMGASASATPTAFFRTVQRSSASIGQDWRRKH